MCHLEGRLVLAGVGVQPLGLVRPAAAQARLQPALLRPAHLGPAPAPALHTYMYRVTPLKLLQRDDVFLSR